MIEVYTLDQHEKWDNIVMSFSDYDTYWLSGYVRAFNIHGDGEPLLFHYEDDNVRGINVVMKRDVANDHRFAGLINKQTYFDFATPYGYGGWIIEGDKSEALFLAYENWCQKNGIISEFVRFHPIIKNHIWSEQSYDVVPLGNVVSIDLSSPEVIWSNLTSKNRNMIRKAQRNGIRIYCGRYPDIYKTFISIYNMTMDKDNANEYYYFDERFYESLCDDLPYNSLVFYAVLDGIIIAASIMLFANGKMNYHLSGSLKEYSSLAPTNLLLYEAALWGSAYGYNTLYLGGGVGSGEDSLFKFKKAFYRKDDLPRFYIGKKVFIQEKYDALLALRETGVSDFFPKYRA